MLQTGNLGQGALLHGSVNRTQEVGGSNPPAPSPKALQAANFTSCRAFEPPLNPCLRSRGCAGISSDYGVFRLALRCPQSYGRRPIGTSARALVKQPGRGTRSVNSPRATKSLAPSSRPTSVTSMAMREILELNPEIRTRRAGARTPGCLDRLRGARPYRAHDPSPRRAV